MSVAFGERAQCIAESARRLHCDRIVMGAAPRGSVTRLLEDSFRRRVIALTAVPVELIVGEAVSRLERYGIPVALAALLAALWAAAD